MLGLIAAIIMLFFKVETSTVLLVFIGFQLFTLAEIERIRFMRDLKARRMLGNAMEQMAIGFREGFNGNRNEEDRKRDHDRNGE